MLSVKRIFLGDLLQDRCPQGISPGQPVSEQPLTSHIHGFGKVHRQLLYA